MPGTDGQFSETAMTLALSAIFGQGREVALLSGTPGRALSSWREITEPGYGRRRASFGDPQATGTQQVTVANQGELRFGSVDTKQRVTAVGWVVFNQGRELARGRFKEPVEAGPQDEVIIRAGMLRHGLQGDV